jgi:hypothetical protein
MPQNAKSPPAATGGAPNLQCLAACGSDNNPTYLSSQAALPNKAKLARRWPCLRVNRLTGRWVDDSSGARGDDIRSLLAFLGEGAR